MRSFLSGFCAAVLFLSSCGGKGDIRDANADLEQIKAEYQQKSKDQVEILDPQPVDMVAWTMKETRAEDAVAQAKSLPPHVRFIRSEWRYAFSKPVYDKEPWTFSITATNTYTYFRPIPRTKFEEYEKKTGLYYDPAQDGVDMIEKVEVQESTFVYDMRTGTWNETGSSVIFNAFGSPGEQ